jgi:hypothetical protein
MRKSLLLVAGLLLVVGRPLAGAQQQFIYCTYNATANGGQPIFYIGTIFQLPPNSTDYSTGETNTAFHDYVVTKYPSIYDPDWQHVSCESWGSYPDAARARQLLHNNDIQAGYRAFYVDFTYAPKAPVITGTATASGQEQKTEAAALFDAEQRAQQSIPFQAGKTFYIKSWDDHSCEPHSRKVSEYSGAATVTTYSCTVKFTYSEDPNPTASAALGQGATQDAAMRAAQLNHAGVTWDEPFCSETRKRAAYGGASYKVGESGASSPWYVCTIGYKAAH